MRTSKLTRKQTKEYVKKGVKLGGVKVDMYITVRYDDGCGNGHNSFSITSEFYNAGRKDDRAFLGGGCNHDAIAKVFPELKPLIKWHMMTSEGPIHYVANTLYHAGDTDCDGYRVGGTSAFNRVVFVDGITDAPLEVFRTGSMYTNRQRNPNLAKCNAEEQSKLDAFAKTLRVPFRVGDQPCSWAISKGKEVDIEAARASAIWPDATLEQLRSREALEARLPALIEEFAGVIESLGMEF